MVLCCCAANNDNYKLQVRDWIIEGQYSLTDPGESMIDKASIKFGRLGKPSTNLPSTHSSFPCFGTAPTCEVHPDPVLLRTVLSFAFPGRKHISSCVHVPICS
uniref:Uncharacterized protein n=1 Tax=Populus trichocarpa TaxID=3694 RepID=A0A2K1XJY1_POPTR